MFRNYIKIAFRNIWKNKVFFLINIIGLSIGLSSAFVIGAMIYYDFTFDKFHKDGERIYRVVTDTKGPDQEGHFRGVPVPLGNALKAEVSGIENVSTFFITHFNTIRIDATGKDFKNPEDIIFAETGYFEVFEYDWLAGSAKNILDGPNEVVITEKRAATYFPNTSAQEVLGKTVTYNDSIIVKITGIVANFKERSDFTFQEFVSRKTAKNTDMNYGVYNESWEGMSSSTQVFIKAKEKANLESLKGYLIGLAKEHENKKVVARGYITTYGLQPLAELHMNDDYAVFDSTRHRADDTVLLGLSLIALFLLILGCINFINLNTAQATKRAKEIGIRKTLGSSKSQLVYQFLGETLFLTSTAAIVSIFFASGLFRLFSEFMPPDIGLALFRNPILIFCTIVLVILITIFSGFYPALVLSQFKPVLVLKNQILPGNDKGSLRKYLTIFQFVIAQIFIIATLLVGRQINYMMTKDMGIKTKSVAYIGTPYHIHSEVKRQRFAKMIEALPEIQEVSLAGGPPASNNYAGRSLTYFAEGKQINIQLQLLNGDKNYLNLYGIKLLAGRKPLNDSIREYVVNETGMKLLGFENPQDIIGQTVKADDKNIPIVGVMEDFNQRSLRSKIDPLAFVGGNQNGTVHFSFRTDDTKNWPNAIGKIEDAWKSIYPEDDFKVQFMDDTIKQFYEQERKTSVLLTWATGLAIAISCLGLLGLVIHTTERRTKEIGIRKILGATLAQLNLLLCKEFLILVGIAFVIAAPIAWWGMNNWLQDFAYKTELSWWVFVLSGVAMLLIALVIISIRTIAAANRNPVKSLRTE
ncbi:ABC-type antimicrobial peptide transport system, permease component [Pricia antarctica]|uniref:ABC-type antimicrobial peptide transport system, permease component n=1 Tax=Pricia antarctica TaxID=641691 RepID=A0A1G6VZ67_9FLAO|nr:ABC transporter permease [Pricia antarctica]SDD58861.1 ABC-type antimicrobial peptide transport system, permease component [Pricia antarctica]